MSAKTKYLVSSATFVIAIFLEVSGISTMLKLRAAGGIKGVGFVLIGLTVGTTAALFHYYYKATSAQTKTQDQVAVETLASLGKNSKPPSKNT